MIQPPYNFSFPIVDKDGHATLQFRQWMTKVSLSSPIVGSGSPEGVVEAAQYQLYIDTAGGAGATEYRKMLPDIGGDVTQGWIQV